MLEARDEVGGITMLGFGEVACVGRVVRTGNDSDFIIQLPASDGRKHTVLTLSWSTDCQQLGITHPHKTHLHMLV